MEPMTTLSEVINHLQKEGYTIDFNLHENGTEDHGNLLLSHPEDFIIDKHYRFEGASDPEDEAVVYAISSAKHHLKGVLVNGYGISSDSVTDKMISSLTERHP